MNYQHPFEKALPRCQNHAGLCVGTSDTRLARDLEKMMLEWRLQVNHSTIYHWILGSSLIAELHGQAHQFSIRCYLLTWHIADPCLSTQEPPDNGHGVEPIGLGPYPRCW